MYKPEDNNKRVGAAIPINFGLIESIANTLTPQANTPSDLTRRKAIAYNMLSLGKLIANWKEIVGLQLASKTYPYRLIKGKLYLSVSDSQWMQTLIFLKGQIISKISEKLPKLKVNEIIGKIGEIPEEAQKLVKESIWPDWKEEKPVQVNGIEDKELADRIARCSQKTSARIKGLNDMGYKLCKICRAVPTRSTNGICAMCLFQSREQARLKTSGLLSDMPWLTYEEVVENDHELTKVEFDDIKSKLLAYSEKLINELGKDLKADFDNETYYQLKEEIMRCVMLKTGCMPDEINLEHLTEQGFPQQWSEYLNLEPTGNT